MSELKNYKVNCKCGHCDSRMYYIDIPFAIKAMDGKEAARIGRNMPRCKHNHKDCVLSVEEIDDEMYEQLLFENANDEYLKCNNIQQQRQIDGIKDRYILDPHYFERKQKPMKEKNIKQLYDGKERIRDVKRYFRNNDDIELSFGI